MTSALPFASYLRVYDPLAAFPEPERSHWAAYAASGAAPDPVVGARREHEAALAALTAAPPLPAGGDDVEHAFVRVRGGQVYVCPWRTQLRSWLALVDFCAGLPGEMVAAFVPAAAVETVENDLEKWVAAHPDLHVHIRTSTWHVPLRWLALFDAAERELILDRRRAAGAAARRCLYVTPMAQARRRAARGLAVLRRAFSDGPVVAGVEDVARWLEEFHPHALVELDYGGLVQLMSDQDLQADDSPALLAESLRALADGDGAAAGAAYERVADRWRAMHALESAN